MAIFAIAYSIGGAAIGVLSGWLTTLATKSGKPRIWKDALFGALVFLIGLIGTIKITIYMQWPENTTTEHLIGGGVGIAVILPFFHEFYRSSQAGKRAHS